MNKELIKTYKVEFDHWLNGGKLQAKFVNDPWEEAPEDIFSYSMVNFTLVIDDEYIEFRKALAENKEVEYSTTDLNRNHIRWVNVLGQPNRYDIYTKVFNYELSAYRIKPERHKFKKGDWVIHNGEYKQVTKAIDGYIDSLDNEVAVIMKEESLELWEPKEGDICWFWNKSNIYPRLATFINESLGSYYADTSNDGFDFCEPYLGKLPSNLKQDSKNISVE